MILATLAVGCHPGVASANQLWFRPTNRFPQRVFGSTASSLPPEVVSLQTYTILVAPRQRGGVREAGVTVVECRGPDQAARCSLAVRTRGPLYVTGEQLSDPDLRMQALDDRYIAVGLSRYRRCWLAWQLGRSDPAQLPSPTEDRSD